MKGAGYEHEMIQASPDTGLSDFKQLLKISPPDGVLIGGAVSGEPSMSYFLEQIINTTHELVPSAKILFYNHSVDVLVTVERWFGARTVFAAAGEMEGLRRLAAAWHRRVMADEEVGHVFSHGFHPQHVERLAAYWAEALGGPSLYSGIYGDETSVVRLHGGNGKHKEMNRRAIACFDQALGDAGIEVKSELGQVLHAYFAWATTTTMYRYHRSADDVPEGLSIPQWSWDGLQDAQKNS
jgi:hemoglobin